MKKAFAALLALCLLMSLAACGGKGAWGTEGVLSEEEVALVESQYLKDINQALQALAVGDVEKKEDHGRFLMEPARKIGGVELRQVLYDSTYGGLTGFYAVSFFTEEMEDEDAARAAIAAVYDELAEAYGQPEYGDFSPRDGLAGWLDFVKLDGTYSGGPGIVTESCSASWTVGDMTALGMSVAVVEDRYFSLSLRYQVQTVKDGRRLEAGELENMVKEFQRK